MSSGSQPSGFAGVAAQAPLSQIIYKRASNTLPDVSLSTNFFDRNFFARLLSRNHSCLRTTNKQASPKNNLKHAVGALSCELVRYRRTVRFSEKGLFQGSRCSPGYSELSHWLVGAFSPWVAETPNWPADTRCIVSNRARASLWVRTS